MKLLSEQVNESEIKVILRELRKTSKLEGDICEFGCYVGTTSVFLAKEIEAWSSNKTLWLYDSFEGLPEKTQNDINSLGEVFQKGELSASKKQLVQNLKKSNIKKMPVIKKAWFNNLTDEDIPHKISFAFLDGDYYLSILDPLKLIWDKLEKGAIVIVDDYGNDALPGASKAVDEWCGQHNLNKVVESSLAIFKKR